MSPKRCDWVDGVCRTCGDVDLGCDLCGESHGSGPCPRVAKRSDAILAQQEKVAELRGELGRLRRAMQEAADHLRASRPIAAWLTLDKTLAVPFPPEP